MPNTMIRLLALILCVVFVSPVAAGKTKPGIRTVYLYNRATGKIIRNCTQIMGKHDAYPTYECPDPKTRKPVPFDPGKDWKPLYFTSPVCMKNRVTGVVKANYVKFKLGRKFLYYEIDRNPPKKRLIDPEKEDLEELPPDDPECGNITFGKDDPIRDWDFDIITDFQKPKKTEPEK